ncbi:MAG: hypothetical protein ABIR24_13445 [Verrucomicrobiota bacterium]
MLTLIALAVIAGTGFGCYSHHPDHHSRRVYEPAGSSREYRYEGDRYPDRYQRDRYYDDRYDGRHQWDNRNYR